jgi:hypothetical protein
MNVLHQRSLNEQSLDKIYVTLRDVLHWQSSPSCLSSLHQACCRPVVERLSLLLVLQALQGLEKAVIPWAPDGVEERKAGRQ